jgi:hypothetical protein
MPLVPCGCLSSLRADDRFGGEAGAAATATARPVPAPLRPSALGKLGLIRLREALASGPAEITQLIEGVDSEDGMRPEAARFAFGYPPRDARPRAALRLAQVVLYTGEGQIGVAEARRASGDFAGPLVLEPTGVQRFSSLDPGFGSTGSAFKRGFAEHSARCVRRAVPLFTLS